MCAYHAHICVVLGVKTSPNKISQSCYLGVRITINLLISNYIIISHFIVLPPCTIQYTMAAPHTSYEPLPRYGHTAVAVDNKVHMWGGWAGSEENLQEVAQNLEVFDISMDQWEQKPTHGTPPPGLRYTAYAVVGSCLFVFGGYGGMSYHNTLYKLNLHSFQWEQVRVSNPSSAPQRKSGCGMVSYGDNQLVVFAGWTGSERTDELHVFDLNKGEYSPCTKPQAKQYYMVHVVQ